MELSVEGNVKGMNEAMTGLMTVRRGAEGETDD